MEGFEKLYSVSHDDESIYVMQKDINMWIFLLLQLKKYDTKLI